jgi:hypothetical protein
MAIRIAPDSAAPTIEIELAIMNPLPDYDLEEVEVAIPREVDGILVTQGFKDLVDDARVVLEQLLPPAKLELVQLTGAICPDGAIFRPGVWIVLRESGAASGKPASAGARENCGRIAEEIRRRFSLS